VWVVLYELGCGVVPPSGKVFGGRVVGFDSLQLESECGEGSYISEGGGEKGKFHWSRFSAGSVVRLCDWVGVLQLQDMVLDVLQGGGDV
jgi:hypothetical protein